jgi:hypothetical protein
MLAMAHDLFLGPTKRDWSCGSILLPAKQQKALFAKVDDVRYDVRRAGAKVSMATLALAASLGFLGLASIYRTASISPNLK